jgi:TonB family protein
VVLHVALLLAIIQLGREQGDIAGAPGDGPSWLGGGGGGGGSAGRSLSDVTYYVTIAPLTPESPTTIELPAIEPIEPLSLDVPPPPTLDAPSAPIIPDIALGGGGTGTGEGPGTGSGTGPGSGSGTGGGDGSGTGPGSGAGTGPGSGAGGRITPPDPAGMMFYPPAPRGVRGRGWITVRVDIDSRGRVTDVELVPPTGNSSYDRELRRRAEEWRFRPARDENGRAVPYTYDYQIEL